MELFGRIRVHEAFRVERLSLMIRATSSRSTERQRNRETERQRDRETGRQWTEISAWGF